MKLTDHSTLVFDCYGTLIDWETGLAGALEPWLARHGVALERDELLSRFAELEAELEAESPESRYPEILAWVHRRLSERLDLPVDEEAARAFAASIADWEPFEDSRRALEELRGSFRLVVLSNVDRESFAVSGQKLGRPFDLVVTAEDVGAYKPDPRGFRVVLARLAEEDVAPEEVLHVAQSLFHDIGPAERLGLATCWIDRRGAGRGFGATPPPTGDVEPDFRFGSMAELVEAVGREGGL